MTKRILFVILLTCFWGLSLSASVALVRDSSIISAQTAQGVVPVAMQPISASATVTLVLLTETLTAADLVRIHHELSKLGNIPVLELSGGSLHGWKGVLPKAGSNISLTDLITEMAANSGALPGDWSNVTFVGRLPSESDAERQSEAWLSAWLGDRFRNQHVRVSFWSLDASTPAWAEDLAQSTLGSVSEALPSIDNPGSIYQASWTCSIKAGAWPSLVTLVNKEGVRLASLNSLCSADGFAPPVASYLAARAALARSPQDETSARNVLQLNPGDVDALAALGRTYRQQKRPKEAALIWRQLSEITPADGNVWAELGLADYYSNSFDEAASALKKAAELGVKSKSTLEIQALLCFKAKDYGNAAQLTDEALRLDSKDQALLLLRADCAHSMQRWPIEAESLERAIQLGPVPLERTSSLIAGYLNAGQPERATEHLRRASKDLPKDAPTQCHFALYWEQAHDDATARLLWQNALAADAKWEPAYVGLAANELRAKQTKEAQRIADSGLELFPKSAPLVLIKEQILEDSGDWHEARVLLAEAGGTTQEALERRARLEDFYGGAGAEAYSAWFDALVASHAPQAQIDQVGRRGVAICIRDEKPELAKEFAAKLAAMGDASGMDLLKTTSTSTTGQTELPGGADAFYFLLFGGGHAKPERILSDAARTFAHLAEASTSSGKSEWQATGQRVHEYFQEIAALSAMGERKGGIVRIELTLANKPGKQRTQKVFDILGLKLKRKNENVSVQSAVGKQQAKKQDTLAALAIDDQAIQDTLAAGKTYVLEIPVDSAPVFPAEELWQQSFYSRGQYPGGLAEAFVTDPRIPRLYVALNSMDRAAAQSLLKSMSLRGLAERYSLPLSEFSSALAVRSGRTEVPGGAAAETLWRNVIGQSPSDPAAFFETLLSKDEGRLIAFFYTLSELDWAHQRFFTRSTERTQRFYELFKDSAEMRRGGFTRLGNSSFTDFLRDVPLNDDGSVDFPGSPQVWMVAKGHNTSSVGKMTRKMKRSATPDDEDEILIRLAKTSYKVSSGQRSELANFIAVTQIDEQRDNPLDEPAALLLAQAYGQYHGLFPYFTELGDLEAADYQMAFSFESKLSSVDAATANLRAGQFHSVLEMLVLLHESQTVAAEKVVAAYRTCLKRYLDASDAAAWTAASLSAVDDLSQMAAAGEKSRDKVIRQLLIGTGHEKRFEQVLALQKVPSLDGLCAIRAALQHAAGPRALDEIDRQLMALAVMPPPKEWKASGERKKYLDLFETGAARSTLAKIREKLAKKKRNEADIDKLSAQLMGQLEPWVQLALTGRIYARFLDPTDLLVSEDAMLLRKHEFVSLGARTGTVQYFESAALGVSSEQTGSRFEGGFAEFSLAAGAARASGNHIGVDQAFSQAMLASIRATDWRGLSTAGLMSFAEPVRLAREWIVASASSPAMRKVLETETRGILSINRRNALLDGVDRHDWPAVWQSVSVSDLHFTGDSLLSDAPADLWNTPALKAMKVAAAHSRELDLLGAVAPDLNGSGQPRLRRYEPYEEYQRHLMPARMAERCAELKLYLAWMADEMAWPPGTMPDIAPAAADALLSKVQTHDAFDWEPLMDAMRSLKPSQVEGWRQGQ